MESAQIISCKSARAAGLKYYFTGKPCKYGHMALRYVSAERCVRCVIIQSREYLASHPEIGRRAAKRFRTRHPEKHLEWVRRWQESNRPLVQAYKAKWWKNNPDAARALAAGRRARKRNAEGAYTADDVETLAQAQRGQCAYCQVRLSIRGLHVDHINPLTRGGSNWPRNLQLLCPSCNSRKHAKDPIEFAREIGRLC